MGRELTISICHKCSKKILVSSLYARTRRKHFCQECRNIGRYEYQWHNVKPTPPGTVKMLTAMSEEIERYFQSKAKQ
jgi:hypothetical protein